MRLVPIEYAKEGMYLAQNLNDRNNRILLKKGVLLNENLLEKIRENEIYSIYIHDEYSENELEDVISTKLRNEAIKTIKDTFGNLEKQFSNKNAMLTKRLEAVGEKNIQSLNDISKHIVDDILASKNIVINLVDIKIIDNYTYQHSVNVAVLSLALGTKLGLNRNELYDLCIGAMLHDIGKSFISTSLILKKGKLTQEEFETAKEHAKKGYDYLKRRYDLNTSVKLIALQHHERIDGTGYPYGHTGDKIHKLSKIVAIADAYDAMVSDTPYEKAVPPNEAIEFITGSAGRNFDFDMVQAFRKTIMPYPVGCLVQLSNGEIGVVEEVKEDFPLRPKVKVVKQTAVTVKMKIFDLMKETNVVIDGILHEVPNACVPLQLGNENSFNNMR